MKLYIYPLPDTRAVSYGTTDTKELDIQLYYCPPRSLIAPLHSIITADQPDGDDFGEIIDCVLH
jgi:hypothetical protein